MLKSSITLSHPSHARLSTLSNKIKWKIVHDQNGLDFFIVTNVPLALACLNYRLLYL